MNLNDFVVIPNTKAKSTKLNGRKLQELRMETVTLAQESEWMEQRLQQLKENMRREKQERGQPEGYRWKSGKAGTMTNPSSANRNKENPLQTQLAPGRLKIRVLKDEPLKAPVPPASQPAPSHASGRKQRLRGKICGQCEVMAAGLACPECGEDYCVGCFAKFHQKGALKLHRMVPIQAELQTHVSTLAVVSNFRRQVNPGARPRAQAPTKAPAYSTADQYLIPRPHLHPDSHCGPHPHHQPQPSTPGPRQPGGDTDPPAAASSRSRKIRGRDRPADSALYHTEHGEVLKVNHGGDKGTTDTEEEDEEDDDSSGDDYDDEDSEREMEEGQEGVEGMSLLDGVYDEEDSALGFQKALREWRGQGTGERRRSGSSGGGGGEENDQRGWRPAEDPPVTMAAIGTQASLPPNRGPERGGGGSGEGRGGGGGGGEGGERVPVNVVFQDDSLCYLDRLLLKNHRRTPIKLHRLNSDPGLDSTSLAHTQDGGADHTLTAEDEDFRRYCASLFAVPTTRGSVGPTGNSPVSCLTIEVLNESSEELAETTGGEPTINRSAMRPSGQYCSTKESEAGAPAGPLRLQSFTSGRPGPAKHSSVSADSTEYKSLRTQLSTKQFPSSHGPAGAAPGAAETTTESHQRPAATSRGSPVPPGARVHESQAPAPSSPTASLRLSSRESRRSSPLCPAASPLCPNTRGSPPLTHLSLRSTFTLTPLTSVNGTLLPEVDLETLPPAAAAGVEGPASRAASALSPGRSRSTRPFPPVSPVWSDPEERPPPVTSLPTGGPPSNLPSSPELQKSSPSPPQRSSRSPFPPGGLTEQGDRQVSQGGQRSSCSSVNHSPSLAPFTPVTAADTWRVRTSTPVPEDPLVSRPSDLAHGGQGSTLPSYPDLPCFEDNPPSRDNGRPGCFIQTDEERSGTEDAKDDMSIDSLGLTLHDGGSSDEDEMEEDGGGSGEWRVREEDLACASNATSEGSLVPEGSESEQEPDAETGEAGFQSKPSRALQALAQRASSGQEQRGGGGSLDGFLTLGLDLQSNSYGGPPEHTEPNEENQQDPMQPRGPDTFHTGAVSWRPSSSLRACAQEHLVSTVMKDSQSRPTGVQHRSTPPTVRRDISTYKPGLSGSPRYPLSARSTSSWCPAPAEEPDPLLSLFRLPPPSLSRPCSQGVSLRPVSRAAQEIQDICGVDRASGEDPSEDADADALTRLEEELRLMVHDTSDRPALMSSAGHGAQGQRKTKDLTWGGLSEEQKQEDEEVARDRQSVLSLP